MQKAMDLIRAIAQELRHAPEGVTPDLAIVRTVEYALRDYADVKIAQALDEARLPLIAAALTGLCANCDYADRLRTEEIAEIAIHTADVVLAKLREPERTL